VLLQKARHAYFWPKQNASISLSHFERKPPQEILLSAA
jgi:hypothetical protein